MPSPAWEDLDAFLSVDEFACSATITLANGTVLPPVAGIFDDPYLDAQLGEYQSDASDPRFLAKEVDIAAVTRKASLVIGATTYDVLTDAQPDGTGMAVLKLQPRT